MTTPVTPSPAATLVLLRDRPPSTVEVLLLQRHAKSKFAAGDYVFAGGKIEADDMPADGEAFCRGPHRGGGGRSARRRPEATRGAVLLGRRHPRGIRGGGRAPRLRERRAPAPHHARVATALRGVSRGLPEIQSRVLRHAARRASHPGHGSACLLRALDHPGGAAHPLRHALLRRPHASGAGAGGGRPRDRRPQVADPADAIAASKRKEIGLRTPTIKNLELVAGGGAPHRRWWRHWASARCRPSAPGAPGGWQASSRAARRSTLVLSG